MAQIPPEVAKEEYGINCEHEKMPNGELRFRLRCDHDGTAYIRTVATADSGWQRSHYHKQVRETYIVQEGWMALATLRDGKLTLEHFSESGIVTTQPEVPHNVYLPGNAVIHTVKHGTAVGKDWNEHTELDQLTTTLTERQILALEGASPVVADIETRFKSYVDVYNNLDKLLWSVPAFFIAAASILLGLIGNTLAKSDSQLSAEVWGSVFFFVGLLFFLGTYSMWRIRLHHTRMGDHIRVLEPQGYFRLRAQTTKRWFPPSAPHLFMVVFGALSLVFFWLTFQLYRGDAWLTQLLRIVGSNQ